MLASIGKGMMSGWPVNASDKPFSARCLIKSLKVAIYTHYIHNWNLFLRKVKKLLSRSLPLISSSLIQKQRLYLWAVHTCKLKLMFLLIAEAWNLWSIIHCECRYGCERVLSSLLPAHGMEWLCNEKKQFFAEVERCFRGRNYKTVVK